MYKILREIRKHRIQVVPGLYSVLVRHAFVRKYPSETQAHVGCGCSLHSLCVLCCTLPPFYSLLPHTCILMGQEYFWEVFSKPRRLKLQQHCLLLTDEVTQ